MATVIPFKGIRPQKNKAQLVVSRSVSTYTNAEIKKELKENPLSFLQVILPDYNQQHTSQTHQQLNKIKNNYQRFIDEGILIQDIKPRYYIYQQQNKSNTYTGIIGCCSIDDYMNGTIKIHEQTITEREEKLKNYLEICGFNAEPVLFSYPDSKELNEITEKITQQQPEYSFKTEDTIHHQLWVVNEDAALKEIEKSFSNIASIYIADGHHRSASSVLLGKLRRAQHPDFTGKEAFNYYLGMFFPETQLKIFDYNRVVKDLNGLSKQAFINKIANDFVITPKTELYKPTKKHNFSMYLQGEWFELNVKKEALNDKDPSANLDSSILSEHLLSPILTIKNLKTNKRIEFISGIMGMEELKKEVDSGKFDVAFGLYPVTIDELKLIADTNHVMPPKTTWIEPKLRSGLVIYDLKD